MGLVLQAVEVASPFTWRWLLSDDETGAPLADHQVRLDPAAEQVTAFQDLYRYAGWQAVPDRRARDQMKIVIAAGAWAGRELLGERVAAAIVEEAPVTVRVSAEGAAGHVLMWPLELAHANGEPLAARGDVSLVYDIAPGGGVRRKERTAGVLRVLAVFSQPTRTSVLALRRERYELARFFRRIAAREGAAVELRVVQYGVTREHLAGIADSGNGWDVLHLAGHGGRGVFMLEHGDGSPDPLDTASLIELLRPKKHRLKLAVVSACESAVETVADTLRLVGLDEQAEDAVRADAEPAAESTEVTGLARALVRELDCAVVAMRYPVQDEFAIAFGAAFYEHVLGRRHPVDVAVARAVAEATGTRGTVVRRALSLATPGAFGVRTAGLSLEVPRGQPVLDPGGQKMSFFPDEPERFVGRTQAMAAANAVLAPESGKTTVLLHGMTGSGKTSCAVELAYRHQDAFAALAFWQAPPSPDEWGGALASLARTLEVQLGGYGFSMAAHIGTGAALEKYLPRLRQVMRNTGILLVLDNLETLLTPDGTWRDPRWELLMEVLTGHGGESRLIMTSQIAPSGLGGIGTGTEMLPVHALSLDESAAFARELPHLRGLLHADDEPDADDGPTRGELAPGIQADRERLRRVLRVVQGHPQMLVFADAFAADRALLDAQLAAAEGASGGQRLDAFFRYGTTALGPGQFLDALAAWTSGALAVLPESARLMAEFLVCLEDSDRAGPVIAATWPGLWRRLGHSSDPTAPEPLLDALTGAALAQAEMVPSPLPDHRPAVTYRVHPGVAAAVEAVAPHSLRAAIDAELAAYWAAAAGKARRRDDLGPEESGRIVRSGLAAAPYLLRLGEWRAASGLLEQAMYRDRSPETVQAVVPALRQIADTAGGPEYQVLLAYALGMVDPAESERMLREIVARAEQDGDYRLAYRVAGNLLNRLFLTTRLSEALSLSDDLAEYVLRAGLGPWTRLGAEGARLQVLGLMGEHRKVLAALDDLLARMRALASTPEVGDSEDDPAIPWNIREVVLGIGHTSALALQEFQLCLDLNAQITESKQSRGAGVYEITRARFNDASPLVGLGRLAEAGQLLRECQQVMEDHGDLALLATVISARADLEDKLGHLETAVHLERNALRIRYAQPVPYEIAIGHYNLASYLDDASRFDQAEQRAHRVAAALIYKFTGMSYEYDTCVRVLAAEVPENDSTNVPGTLSDVIGITEQSEGVRLGELIAELEPDRRFAEEALAQIRQDAATVVGHPAEGEEAG